MSDHPQPSDAVLDENWFAEWFAFGYLELTAYLAKWARFDEYLSRRAAAAGDDRGAGA